MTADGSDPSSHPKSTREDALAVVKRLREAGYVAYFAGGCVRDTLLGRPPKDYDVATDAPPKRVRELFHNTQAVGAAFGVILVRHHKSQIEVATFRAEGGYNDGRHPSEIRFTTAEEDAHRRDFTINGLFCDPVTDEIIDYVGGRQDLAEGRIRAIGDPTERFEEDSLRLLRAIRFSARFGFPIEPRTAAAIVAHAQQLKRVSPERIAEELRIMLTPATRPAAWRLLWEFDLVHVIFRYLHFPRKEPEPGSPYLFDLVMPHVNSLIAEGGSPGASEGAISFGLALAAAVLCYQLQTDEKITDPRTLLTRQRVQSAVQSMRQGLKISNEESEHLRGALAGLEPLLADETPGIAKLKRFLAEPTADSSRSLLSALSKAGIESNRITELEPQLAELEKTEYAPVPLIDGDLLTEHGLQPGPNFKRILNAVYDAQLEGRVTSREQAAELALRINAGLGTGS